MNTTLIYDDIIHCIQEMIMKGDVMQNNNNQQQQEQPRYVQYHAIDGVALQEVRAVRSGGGMSYSIGKARFYSGRSESEDEWTTLGVGTLTLEGDKCFFVGGGQSRTIQTNKINSVTYFTDKTGIEVSVSNRQKSMRFYMRDRPIEDGARLAEAMLNGLDFVWLNRPVVQKSDDDWWVCCGLVALIFIIVLVLASL